MTINKNDLYKQGENDALVKAGLASPLTYVSKQASLTEADWDIYKNGFNEATKLANEIYDKTEATEAENAVKEASDYVKSLYEPVFDQCLVKLLQDKEASIIASQQSASRNRW